jgi:hypothetical protein
MANNKQEVAHTTLDGLFMDFRCVDEIWDYVGHILPELAEEPIAGEIFDQLKRSHTLERTTNF